jgi:hypothetical protein
MTRGRGGGGGGVLYGGTGQIVLLRQPQPFAWRRRRTKIPASLHYFFLCHLKNWPEHIYQSESLST